MRTSFLLRHGAGATTGLLCLALTACSLNLETIARTDGSRDVYSGEGSILDGALDAPDDGALDATDATDATDARDVADAADSGDADGVRASAGAMQWSRR